MRTFAETAFPTLFKPMDLPKRPEHDDAENEAVLACLGNFLDSESLMTQRPRTRSTPGITCEVSDRKMRAMLGNFVDLHRDRGMCKPASVKHQLTRLEVGSYWGVHLVAQNSVLLLHRESVQSTVAMVWEVQASNARTMDEKEAPTQSLPRAAVRVKDWDKRIQEVALGSFSELLADLADNEREKAQPMAYKAGQQQKETREVTNANLYGVEYLLSVLGGEPLAVGDAVMRKGLHKKQCDEVQYESSELPWRRAPIWAAAKTLAHVVCRQCHDGGMTAIGTELSYKFFVQRLLAQVLGTVLPDTNSAGSAKRKPVSSWDANISQSAVLEAARKLVRRQVKLMKVLQQLHATGGKTFDTLKQLALQHDDSTAIVENAVALIKKQWNRLREAPNHCVLDPAVLVREETKGTLHKLTSSGALLERLGDANSEFFLCRARQRMAVGMAPEEPQGRGYLESSNWFLDNLTSAQNHLNEAYSRWKTAPQDVIGVLHDLKEQIWSDFHSLPDSVAAFSGRNDTLPGIMRFHKRYVTIGRQVFDGDPRGCGEIALTALTLVSIVDMLATEAHPPLKEHPLPVSPGLFQYLFVTTHGQKCHLHRLENYVRERNRSAHYSTTTIEGGRSGESFSVRFARQDSGMQATHREILNICTQNQRANEKLRREKREKHDNLMAYVRRHGCSCRWSYDRDGDRYKSHYCLSCEKESQAKSITMIHYEKLLPDDPIRQWAVVFELKQPGVLICQRQILFDFLLLVCGQEWNSESESRYLWSDEGRLSPFRKSPICSSLTTCELGSVRKKWSQSHYNRSNNHITAKESFIVSHDYQTILMGPIGPVDTATPSWWTGTEKGGMRGRLCTIEIPHQSHYRSLHSMFNGYTHSENDAIAAECPPSLTLAEFRSCGTLRAGPRHQLVRLASCLRQKVLSLERPEPVALVLCALWQAGPRLELSDNVDATLLHFRQSCQQMLDENFVADLTGMLDETLTESQENWAYHNRLVFVTLVAHYVHVHTQPTSSNRTSQQSDCETQQELVTLLDKCMAVAKTWIGMIMEHANNCGDEGEMQRLRAKLVDVAAAGTLSLTTDMLEDTRAEASSRRVGDVLFFRAIFNDNFSPAEIDQKSSEKSKRFFRRMLILHGFAHAEQMRERVGKVLDDTKSVSGLNRFLTSYWSKHMDILKGVKAVKWNQYKITKSCWYAAVCLKGNQRRLTYLQMDVVSGAFFVDGLPCKSLPRSVSASNTYKRHFGTSMFIVQPTGQGGYRTQMPVSGCYFEFYPSENCLFDADGKLFGDGEPVILKETSVDKKKAILLPHFVVAGDFPAKFVDDHSHWFELEKAKVHFQPVKYNNDAYVIDNFRTTMNAATCYILERRILSEVVTGRKLIDVRGNLFKHLYDNVMVRLSPSTYVHVWQPNPSEYKEDKKLLSEKFFGWKGGFIVQLPQLQNIRFDIDKASGRVRSREFGGEVSKDQNLDTLIGLHHGIILEGASDSVNKMFLCPHGKVIRTSRDENTVAIDTTYVRSPPFFRFEVRPELRDLKSCSASRLQWLFLSQLHLATGGLLPDPFTGATGTQRALDIFRSGRCAGNPLTSMSCAHFGPALQQETKLLLESLTVSTARSNYHNMEKTDRNRSYHALCAPASIGFMVKNRLDEIEASLAAIGQSQDSEELDLPTKRREAKISLSLRTNALCERSYWQSRERYPKDTLLSPDEEQKIFGRTLHGRVCHHSSSAEPLSQISPGFEGHITCSMQHLCYAAQNKGYEVQPSANMTLSTLLCSKSTGDNLTGVTKRTQLSGAILSCFRGIAGLDSGAATRDMDGDECLPSFEQLWLDLYHIAQNVVPGSADKKLAFGALLGHVLTEYPDHGPHLHQLAAVASYGDRFPPAPSHQSYHKPYEQNFYPHYVHAAIDKNLEQFIEDEPKSHTYDSRGRATKNYSHTCWENRREDHHQRRTRAMSELESTVHSLWNAGKSSVSSHEVFNAMVANSSSLERTITRLFMRWRNAIELKNFVIKVQKTLASWTFWTLRMVRTPNLPTLVSSLVIHSAPVHSGKSEGQRNNLVLETTIDFTYSESSARIATPCQVYAKRKNPFTYPAVLSKIDVGIVEHLDLTSKFINKDQQYAPLWDKLTKELQKSWTLAQHESDVDPSVLENPFVKQEIKSKLQTHAKETQKVLQQRWRAVQNILSPNAARAGSIVYSSELQLCCGLWNAVTPFCVLKTHFGGNATGKDNAVRKLLTNFALSIRDAQRARRCLRRLDAGPTAAVHLLHDLKEAGCEGWNPQEYPEFLALEIDNDYLMRSVQARVAFEMLDDYRDSQNHPTGGHGSVGSNFSENTFSDAGMGSDACSNYEQANDQKSHQNRGTQNRTMQMNMGAGKSAVIMPCVLAIAGAGGKCLARATVLSSLYATNAADWQLKLGGLLDRRVLPLICRRDLPITETIAKQLLKTCQVARDRGDVIVTVPEHRLSLENKALELASEDTSSPDLAASKVLQMVVHFWGQHGREILDESDEILSPLYQLIYTLGAQLTMEGAPMRWAVHAAIYGTLARHGGALQREFGAEVVELTCNNTLVQHESDNADPHEYPGLRLLDDASGKSSAAYEKICELVVNDILNGRADGIQTTLTAKELKVFLACVRGSSDPNILACVNPDRYPRRYDALPLARQRLALTLRGLLSHEVLRLCLTKRWRVNYGAHPLRPHYDMAVPMKAKDVAAEKTEFGHPDVAVSLTFASYYYAGLNSGQLQVAFTALMKLPESKRKAVYRQWAERLPADKRAGIAALEGVNLEDKELFKLKLYPAFHKHMDVINFWLLNKVLPVQAKQFPRKLVATAPDLCRSVALCPAWRAVTTGFSGTDDLSLVLPETIKQQNMVELQGTNGVQLRRLLRPENNQYITLQAEEKTLSDNSDLSDADLEFASRNSTKQILDILGTAYCIKKKVNVVLDPGALLLHLTNAEFAKAWLEKRSDMEATVFFEDDYVKVFVRGSQNPIPFGVSSYADDMSRCLLYLDDIHTRGSDFRLPLTTRALLTLGKSLPKDKFCQSCMRLRQLGVGQSLVFVASPEVNCMLKSRFFVRAVGCNYIPLHGSGLAVQTQSGSKVDIVHAILLWTLSNSVRRICDLLPYLAGQTVSSLRKAQAFSELVYGNAVGGANASLFDNDTLKALASRCIESEILALFKLYGHTRSTDLLPHIVDRALDSITGTCVSKADDSNTTATVSALKQRVRDIAPRVKRPCAMLNEEQERELEAELEEEAQVERPPPKIAKTPHISKGLINVVKRFNCSSAGACNTDDIQELCKAQLTSTDQLFKRTTLHADAKGQFDESYIFITKDFTDTVKGISDLDNYTKDVRWIMRVESLLSSADKQQVLIFVSNFEAEHYSYLLARHTRAGGSNYSKGTQVRLYPFAALVRLGQPRLVLRASIDPPAAVHVLAGSVHADSLLLKEIQLFLGLVLRIDPAPWDALLSKGLLERDGFVPKAIRESRRIETAEFRKLLNFRDRDKMVKVCTFSSSPVKFLTAYYANVRHLGEELSTSAVGRLLGASETEQRDDADT